MSTSAAFRKHCLTMATADHKPECPSLPKNQPYWQHWHGIYEDGEMVALGWNGPPPPAPTCDGCVTDADRALWLRMAGELALTTSEPGQRGVGESDA